MVHKENKHARTWLLKGQADASVQRENVAINHIQRFLFAGISSLTAKSAAHMIQNKIFPSVLHLI